MDETLDEFYHARAGAAPRPLLLNALARLPENYPGNTPPGACDLGCGFGAETLALLRRGWRVLAIDKNPRAIKTIEDNVHSSHRLMLEAKAASFEQIELPPLRLVYAAYSLPFCRPAEFQNLWSKIIVSLQSGGIFAGHFFGPADSWANDPEMTFHTRSQIDGMFSSFKVLYRQEMEEEGGSGSGPKHWHVFEMIARSL